MRYVNSGSGRIPLVTLLAILSISLIVNLPGLAVSPLLGKLKEVFPDVSELQTQLLITLPNFVIIPFILLSGKFCNVNNQLKVLSAGLIIYMVSGVLFLFASSMIELILLSCLLGIGCGLCIPLAASLLAQNFTGRARTRELGMKSGVSNFTVIFATLFVGWVASIGWHLAFLVYLLPIVPLCLMPFMTRKFIDAHAQKESAEATAQIDTLSTQPNKKAPRKTKQQIVMLLLGVIGLYIILTYSTTVISDYVPFTMTHYGMNTTEVGIATALYFLGATCSGFTLTWMIDKCRRATPYLALALCVLGLYACGLVHTLAVYMIAIFLIGFGYGLLQPIIYDKTAYLAPTAEKSTQYFGYTLTGNYIAIALVPFVVDPCAKLLHDSTLNFPYILNGTLLLAVMCIGFFKCRSFVFDMEGAK